MPLETDTLFKQTLTHGYNDDAGWEAIRALQATGARTVFDEALRWCESDNAMKRARGADILAQFGVTPEQHTPLFSNESCNVLLTMAKQEKEPMPLAAAITAFGHLHHPHAVSVVVEFAGHKASEVRFSVAFALGHFADDPVAISTLIALMEDKEGDIRNWATFSLGVQGDADSPAIRDALIKRLSDKSEDARLEAMVALAKRKDERVVPPLLVAFAKRNLAVAEVEAACLMLDMQEDRREWEPADYAKALRERYPIPAN